MKNNIVDNPVPIASSDNQRAKRRRTLGLLGMTALTTALAVPAFAYECQNHYVFCPNNSGYTITVCCNSGQMNWAVCICDGWDSATGYYDCHSVGGCC